MCTLKQCFIFNPHYGEVSVVRLPYMVVHVPKVYKEENFVFETLDEDLKKKRQWLDVEVEKILQQKHDIETLQEDLKKREDIIKQKENMMAEKSTLEMKKLRSSQIINKVNLVHLPLCFISLALTIRRRFSIVCT
ncbi:Kinesin-like protein KIF27 [Exaiptasia diaphana]|nr:Kinesin-like protein KIF27 [Exaiptasia diaphana]